MVYDKTHASNIAVMKVPQKILINTALLILKDSIMKTTINVRSFVGKGLSQKMHPVI